MDLSAYHPSLEWDLMSVTSRRHEQLYPGCCGQDKYIDITFGLGLRRKTLFYAVNLVTPCMLIAILTVFVFYIPACEHKMTYSISVLVTLTVFYLILIELIPPTSMVIPLIGRYLLFTMFLVTFSIAISVVTLNFHRRDGTLHTMPRWIYRVFIQFLPKILLMTPPAADDDAQSENDESTSISDIQPPYGSGDIDDNFGSFAHPYRRSGRCRQSVPDTDLRLAQMAQVKGMSAEVLRRMVDNVHFVAEYFRAKQKRDKVSENWSYVAMVLDRLLLIIFSTSLFIGTLLIISSSPPAKSEWGEPLSAMPPTKPLSGDTFEFELRETMMMSMNGR
uniref:Neur_chan_memb domain-containing protein n=1 Tax=Globodera pallida TaxID=36090 RepID=A0A183CGM3_GLOPA